MGFSFDSLQSSLHSHHMSCPPTRTWGHLTFWYYKVCLLLSQAAGSIPSVTPVWSWGHMVSSSLRLWIHMITESAIEFICPMCESTVSSVQPPHNPRAGMASSPMAERVEPRRNRNFISLMWPFLLLFFWFKLTSSSTLTHPLPSPLQDHSLNY